MWKASNTTLENARGQQVTLLTLHWKFFFARLSRVCHEVKIHFSFISEGMSTGPDTQRALKMLTEIMNR